MLKVGELVKHRSMNGSVGIILKIEHEYYHIKWLCFNNLSLENKIYVYSILGVNSYGVCQVKGV